MYRLFPHILGILSTIITYCIMLLPHLRYGVQKFIKAKNDVEQRCLCCKLCTFSLLVYVTGIAMQAWSSSNTKTIYAKIVIVCGSTLQHHTLIGRRVKALFSVDGLPPSLLIHIDVHIKQATSLCISWYIQKYCDAKSLSL